MRFLPYVLKHLRRNWVRTTSTVFALALCVFLICTLQTFLRAVTWNLQSANATRLIIRHAVSLVFNLPIAYGERILAIPGVRSVAKTSWFGGARRAGDFRDFFPNFAIDAEPYLAMYPEYLVPEDQKHAFMADLRGAIVGRETAEKFGWKIGAVFQLESFIPPYRIGKPFEFVVSGLYDTDEKRFPGTLRTLMFFHYKYLYESTDQRVGAGTYVVQIDDAARAPEVGRAIDALFENSDAQTHTETEAAFRAGFVSLAGNLTLLLNGIALAVLFTILLVTANTMGMAVRERRMEIAVLKTVGFPAGLILALVLGESMLIGAIGGVLGILLGAWAIGILPYLPIIGDAVRGFPHLALAPDLALIGLAVAVAIGAAAGLPPAIMAARARVTEILRPV
jgi:putative ABC transport system permease protein